MKSAFAACLILVVLAAPAAVWSQEPAPVSAEKLIDWLNSAAPPVVIDVRGHAAYRTGSLPGAIDAGTDPLGYLPAHGTDPVVLLSGTVDAARLAAWTARLAAAGHPVWLLSGGIDAWIGTGGSVEAREPPYRQPGRVPFLIPKGLCEGGEPAQVFE